VHISPLQLS